VDFYVSGHDHDFQLFDPMSFNGAAGSKGVRQLVVGGGTSNGSGYQIDSGDSGNPVVDTGFAGNQDSNTGTTQMRYIVSIEFDNVTASDGDFRVGVWQADSNANNTNTGSLVDDASGGTYVLPWQTAACDPD
jgi:hypothetical protein